MANYIRAQAALEFLTTYGWAFLVILIMIGTLAYFGILSPSKILPNRCNFGAEFQCLDHQISASGASPNPQIKLRLKNNIGEAIIVSSMTYKTESATVLTCTPPSNLSNWKSGEILNLAWTDCTSFGGMIAGEKGKVLFTVQYYSVISGSGYTKEVKGEIFSNVI